MQTRIKSIKRLANVETGEILNKISLYITDSISNIKSRKNGFVETETNSFSLYDSYVYSIAFDAVSGLKEGRIYKELLSDSIDTDKVLELLLANANIEISVSKEDSENSENSLGFYFRYDVTSISLDIDIFTKVSIFEIYLSTYREKSKAYLSFVAKMLNVYDVFAAELS